MEHSHGPAEHNAVAIAQHLRLAAGNRPIVDRGSVDAAQVKEFPLLRFFHQEGVRA